MYGRPEVFGRIPIDGWSFFPFALICVFNSNHVIQKNGINGRHALHSAAGQREGAGGRKGGDTPIYMSRRGVSLTGSGGNDQRLQRANSCRRQPKKRTDFYYIVFVKKTFRNANVFSITTYNTLPYCGIYF